MCTQPPWNKFTLPEDSLVFSTTFLSTSWAPLSVYYWTEHTIDFFLFFSWRVCIVYALVFFQLFQLSPWKTSLYSESEMCCVAMLVDSLNSIYFSDHVHFFTGLIMALLFTFLQWIQAHAHFPDFHQPKQIFFFSIHCLMLSDSSVLLSSLTRWMESHLPGKLHHVQSLTPFSMPTFSLFFLHITLLFQSELKVHQHRAPHPPHNPHTLL